VHAVEIADSDNRTRKRLFWRAGGQGIRARRGKFFVGIGAAMVKDRLRNDPGVVQSHGPQSQGTGGAALVGGVHRSG